MWNRSGPKKNSYNFRFVCNSDRSNDFPVSSRSVSEIILEKEGVMLNTRHLIASMAITLLATVSLTGYLSGDPVSTEEELYQVRTAILERGAPWVAKENEISRMDPEERRTLLGLIPEDHETGPVRTIDPMVGLPTSFDWRVYNGHNWMTEVKDQANCGSCVMFGSLAAMEGWLNILMNDWTWDVDLSEQHLLSCGSGSCASGWSVSSAMRYLTNHGAPEEDCFVYQAADRDCSESCSDWEDHTVEIRDWEWVNNDESTIKSYLQNGPLTTTMTVYTDFFYYSSGVYSHSWGSIEGGHCITFVGWDDDASCWICKNSWGASWGENGYFRIEYGNSGIGSSTSYMELYPLIQVYTDKYSYLGGDELALGIKVVNPGTEYTADVEIWVRTPGGADYSLYSGVYTIPADVNFTKDDFMTVTVPASLAEGEYTLYGVIRDSSGLETNSFDIHPFEIIH